MDEDIIVTLKRSNDLLMTFGNDYSDVFLPAIDEIEQLRKDKQLGFELMDAFIIRIHRLRQGLYRIANMKHDEDFGLPPITDAIKIAQDALEEE
jgi:hypothetical protein